MAETTASSVSTRSARKAGRPTWVDAATPDVDASVRFYTGLFGWSAEAPSAEAGGYVVLTLGGEFVAGIGPVQDGQFPAWTLYFATPDADAIGVRVQEAGGKVIVPAFDVLKSGRMAVFQDPAGTFFSVWQANEMPGFGRSYAPNAFSWGELNAKGIDKVTEFYTKVFGWGIKKTEGGDGSPPYAEWQQDGKSIGGAMDLNNFPEMSEVPGHWMIYFEVSDIDAATAKVRELGGRVQKEPADYPGGRFAIVADPTGPHFGLMESTPQA